MPLVGPYPSPESQIFEYWLEEKRREAGGADTDKLKRGKDERRYSMRRDFWPERVIRWKAIHSAPIPAV